MLLRCCSIYILDGEGQGSILAGVGVEPRLCSGAWQNACVPQLCLEQLEQLQVRLLRDLLGGEIRFGVSA